jgi:predicted dehydrogenase
MITLGLIGCGVWGQKIIQAIQSLDDAKLTAVCRKTDKSVLGYKTYTNWQEMLQKETFDGLIVASPPDLHLPIIIAASERNLPVFVEKPLALNIQEVNKIYHTQLSTSISILVDYIHLFAPAYIELKRHIRSPITKIVSSGIGWGPERDYSSLYDYGPHDIAMIYDLKMCEDPKWQNEAVTDVNCRIIEKSGKFEIFYINLKFDEITTESVVGNGSKEKERKLSVECANGDRLVYNNFVRNKLTFNGELVETDNVPPLRSALSAFIQSMKENLLDPRFGLDLSMKVHYVLDKCTQKLI